MNIIQEIFRKTNFLVQFSNHMRHQFAVNFWEATCKIQSFRWRTSNPQNTTITCLISIETHATLWDDTFCITVVTAFKQGEFWLDKVWRNSCSDNQGNEECLRWEEARNSLTFFSPERQRLTVDTIDSGRSGRDKSRMEKSYNSKWQCWHNIVSTNSAYLNLGWKLEVSIHQTRPKLLSHGISGSKNKWINQPGENCSIFM